MTPVIKRKYLILTFKKCYILPQSLEVGGLIPSIPFSPVTGVSLKYEKVLECVGTCVCAQTCPSICIFQCLRCVCIIGRVIYRYTTASAA